MCSFIFHTEAKHYHLLIHQYINNFCNIPNFFFFPRPEVIIPDDGEEVNLVELDRSQRGRRHQNQHMYDEDDDDHHAGRHVQCQTS